MFVCVASWLLLYIFRGCELKGKKQEKRKKKEKANRESSLKKKRMHRALARHNDVIFRCLDQEFFKGFETVRVLFVRVLFS